MSAQGSWATTRFSLQGIMLEHREKEFGDKVNLLAVLKTARNMKETEK